jgi:hypothetical protein
MRFYARAAAAVGTAAVLAVAAAGPAAAHFCYKTGNPNNGTNGQAWMTQEEWLGFIDAIEVVDSDTTSIATCEAQLAAVRAHIAGLDESVRIMGPALLAGGTLGTDRTPKDIGYTPIWLIAEDCVLVFPGE